MRVLPYKQRAGYALDPRLEMIMKEPGLDGRHRDKDGTIQKKRADTKNKNLPTPIPTFGPETTLKKMRERTGKTSEKDIRNATKIKG
jgi:hypothetical protein